jgi:hypothetical protein
MILATCLSLAAALADPAASGLYKLTENCPARDDPRQPAAFPVVAWHAAPMTVDLGGHTVAGIRIREGGNVTFENGTIEAPRGSGFDATRGSPHFYGIALGNARQVTLRGITLTNARKALAISRGGDITLTKSRCTGRVEDCVIATGVHGLTVTHNWAGNFEHRPRRCTYPDGQLKYNIAGRVCLAAKGTFVDGWHGDFVQHRDGATDILVAHNVIETPGQGGGQMESRNDAPLARIVWRDNDIKSLIHQVTLTNCSDCLIANNKLSRYPGSPFRAYVRPGTARACGNSSPDGTVGSKPC